VRKNSCLSVGRIGHALFGVLLVLAVSSAGAQQTSEAARLPGLSFLETLGAPQGGGLAAVERGEVVVWSVAGADRDEVALVGLMRVAVPRDFYFARTSNVTAFLTRAGREAFGVLGTPPTLADLASMKLDPSDAAGIRKCRVSHCSIKLPEQQMAVMASTLASHRDDRSSPADSLMREWLLELVTDYHARGDAALPVYDDTRPAEQSAAGFRQLLGADAPMFRDAPTFASYLAESPAHPVAGATSTIFWAVDRKPGLKPILSLSRLSTFRGAGPGAPMFVATKQLYASHYFDAWLDVESLVAGPASEPSTYVAFVRRVRFDKLPSRGLFDVRGRVVRQLRDALHEELTSTRQSVHAAFEASEHSE
jgi:hypothetical protein